MTEKDHTREYSFVRYAETPGGASQSSTHTSDGSYSKSTDTYSPSEHRTRAQHAKHLPSRTIAILSKAKHDKFGNVAKLSYNTIRIPTGGFHLAVEDHANNIASHMELHDDLMQNDPMSEMRRIETLREMPQCLTVKRSIRAKLTVSVNRRSKRESLGYWKTVKYAASISFMKIGITMKEVSSSLELWYHAIKTVEGHFGSGVATYFKFLRWLFLMNMISCILSICLVTVPQSLVAVSNHTAIDAWDIFIGNGYLQDTILYYGFYGNQTIELISDYKYSIPSAYFLTLWSCYIFTFVLLSVKVARSYRKCYIETAGGTHNLYTSKIFCGWDFGVSSYKAANLCSASIHRELRELLAEADVRVRPSFLKRLGDFLYHCAVTILVVTLMAGIGVSLWALLDQHQTHQSDPWSFLLVPFVITTIMNIFPTIVSVLVKFERYSNKRVALYVTLIRIYAMTAVIISILLFYWLSNSTEYCWQTDFAQEIYRLVILDFIVSVVGNFVVQAIRYRLHRLRSRSFTPPKFEIASNTLNLIYNEILFWVAFYFSPPLSIVIVAKIILTFYIKKYGLTKHCEPPSASWRAAQTQTLFLVLAFLSMIGILGILGYIVTSVKSSECGPFRDHDYTWEAVIDSVLQLRRDGTLWSVLTYLTKPGTGAAILIAMSMTVYCLRAKAESSKQLVLILREMLVLQSRDKDFLLKEFSKVADENWLRRRANNRELRRETHHDAFTDGDDIEMSELSKPAGRSERAHAAGDTLNLESPSTSGN